MQRVYYCPHKVETPTIVVVWNKIGSIFFMKKVILKFETFDDLNEYAEVINIDKCNVNYKKLTIRGELSDADIELAVMDHHASVLQEMEAD